MDVKGFENFIFEKMTESRFPGISVAMVKGDELVYSRGFGMADVEKATAATAETMYPAASITKSFLAIAILQLAEQGKLSVEDLVEKYVEFPLKVEGGPVRIRHLLTHTTGVTALAYVEALIGTLQGLGGTPVPVAGPKDVPLFMRGAEGWIWAGVGKRWFYNNEQYVLLGAIVAKVAGVRWGDYVRENILQPLGMARSAIDEKDIMGLGQMSVPYVVRGDEPVRAGRQLFNLCNGDAGLYTNVLDLGKYMSMFLRKGKPVMTEGSWAEMTKGRVAMPAQPSSGLFGETERVTTMYGYALQVKEFFGEEMLGHGGSVTVSTGHVGFLPKSGVGVAILGNSGAYTMKGLCQVALAYLTGRDPWELDYLRVEKALKELTGSYEGHRRIMRAVVKRDADFLKLQYVQRNPQDAAVTLVPEKLGGEEMRFFTYAEGAKVGVEFRKRGGVWEMLHERYMLKRVGPAT